jgi:hypothetical protein
MNNEQRTKSGIKLINIGPYWLSDFMAGYTVENMSFAPADSFDLERLLASTQTQGQGHGQGQGQGQGSMTGGSGQMSMGPMS